MWYSSGPTPTGFLLIPSLLTLTLTIYKHCEVSCGTIPTKQVNALKLTTTTLRDFLVFKIGESTPKNKRTEQSAIISMTRQS